MHPDTRAFFLFLRRHPALRARIKAPKDKTLLYAGAFIRPMWDEVAKLKDELPQARDKQTLAEVLNGITLEAPAPFARLLAWVQHLDTLQPIEGNGFIVWCVVSRIFAANASGKVSFQVGSGISRQAKVFAAIEMAALARNPDLDPLSREMLGYYESCLERNESGMNAGFIAS